MKMKKNLFALVALSFITTAFVPAIKAQTVENGMLVFRDVKAYTDYRQKLSTELSNHAQNKLNDLKRRGITEEDKQAEQAILDGFDGEMPLKNSEARLAGFTSLRKANETKLKDWLAQNELNPATDPFGGLDFISASIVNANRQLKVGASVVTLGAKTNAAMGACYDDFDVQYHSGGSNRLIRGTIEINNINSFTTGYVLVTTTALRKVRNRWYFWPLTTTCASKSGFVYKKSNCESKVGINYSNLCFPGVTLNEQFYFNLPIGAKSGTGHVKSTHKAFGVTFSMSN